MYTCNIRCVCICVYDVRIFISYTIYDISYIYMLVNYIFIDTKYGYTRVLL